MSPNMLCIIPAAIILWRLLHMMSTLDRARYQANPTRYLALVGHWTLLAAGAVASVLNLAPATPLLLTGAALLVLADRRRA